MMLIKRIGVRLAALSLLLWPALLRAQTDQDAIMMSKNLLCVGASYGYSSWNEYWEGTFHRNNPNLGTASTQMAGLMGIYGVTRKFNVEVNVPYIWTHSTAGTLHGQKGFQDLSVWLKWKTLEQNVNSPVSVFVLGGASVPMTNYIADYLPLAIGMQSKTLSGRLILDYQHRHFFVTASGTYTWRGDITIDRDAYYTTSLHLTNQVDMPNMMSEQLRTGYRNGDRWVAEAVVSNMNTLGGFDITRNNMPFPSNKMNETMIGAHVKHGFKAVDGLSLDVDGAYTVAGRNMGQSTMFDVGVYYIFHFSKKASKHSSNQSSTN
ncbi:MAG TPA: hypothetical protein VGQ51_08955 [Puia sp.]|jgi:hypothetical protein|nr:hypothetical protein [Puia sp.]